MNRGGARTANRGEARTAKRGGARTANRGGAGTWSRGGAGTANRGGARMANRGGAITEERLIQKHKLAYTCRKIVLFRKRTEKFEMKCHFNNSNIEDFFPSGSQPFYITIENV